MRRTSNYQSPAISSTLPHSLQLHPPGPSSHSHSSRIILYDPTSHEDSTLMTTMGQWNYMYICNGFQFCSNSILAHHDYGEMAYTDGMRGCNYHGI